MGRPPKSAKTLTREGIIRMALPLLEQGGEPAISFRALAGKLGVTPMAVAHHTGSKEDLIRSMVEVAFIGLDAPLSALNPEDRLSAQIKAYCARAAQHAQLIRLVLQDLSRFQAPLTSFTFQIEQSLRDIGIPEAEVPRTLGLLVDYTHGVAISLAENPSMKEEVIEQLLFDHASNIDWIIARLLPS